MKISPGSEGVESPDFTAIEIPVRVLSSGDFWLTSATGSMLLIAYYQIIMVFRIIFFGNGGRIRFSVSARRILFLEYEFLVKKIRKVCIWCCLENCVLPPKLPF